jgi:predicted molibdopterin-dependent oxidoreductase YjgC
MGARFRYNTAEEVFNDIALHVEAYRGMTYRQIGNKGMMLRAKKDVPVST